MTVLSCQWSCDGFTIQKVTESVWSLLPLHSLFHNEVDELDHQVPEQYSAHYTGRPLPVLAGPAHI